MTARIANVTLHAEDPKALSQFWAAVMGYPEPDGYPPELEAELRAAGFDDEKLAERSVAWDDDPTHQRFYFSKYTHGKRHRNRMHLDITPFADRRASREELEAERDRLIALGATEEKVVDSSWGPYEEYTIMMRDPEGNEFCLQ